MKNIFYLICLIFISSNSIAQSYYFGFKGGPTLGFQQDNGYDRNPLLRYHGYLFIESAPEDNSFALFGQLGYHLKGSALGGGLQTEFNTGNLIRIPAEPLIYRNIDFVLGAKQKFDVPFWSRGKAYYLFGARVDYTVSTNLDTYQERNFGYYPSDFFVRKWNYGATIGGGFEFNFSEFIGGLLEFNIHPDFSNQYEQPSITTTVTNPYTGTPLTISQSKLRNTVFEVSLGLRFLRKIIYVD